MGLIGDNRSCRAEGMAALMRAVVISGRSGANKASLMLAVVISGRSVANKASLMKPVVISGGSGANRRKTCITQQPRGYAVLE